MVRFDLRLLNFPGEKLFKPRKRLAGINIPEIIKQSIAFAERDIEKINEESDVIILTDYMTDMGFENIQDLNEFITTHEFYIIAKNHENKEGVIKIITALKYLFAAKRVLQGLVADDTIFTFHLPYLTEACYDLDCSVLLAKENYFKQSLQTLRNVIEVSLTHAYYAFQDIDYDDLVESENHRIPEFKNLIKFLRTENLLTAEMERQLFELYKTLSQAVHSEILKLNCSSSGNYKTFLEWYDLYVKCARMYFSIIIRLMEVGV